MTTHTPGPWGFYVEPNGDSPIVYVVDDHCTPHDILRGESGFGLDITRANARLIAAAPDLLATLKELIDLEGPLPGNVAWFNKAVAAVARAEGRK